MKKNVSFFYPMIFLLFIFFQSCSESGIYSPEYSSIKYISFKDNGCDDSGLYKTGEGKTLFLWKYFNSNLHLEFMFTSLCSAEITDSVILSGNTISIFAKDTSGWAAKCICPFREEFDFELFEYDKVYISFNFDAYASDGYYNLIDTLLVIPK